MYTKSKKIMEVGPGDKANQSMTCAISSVQATDKVYAMQHVHFKNIRISIHGGLLHTIDITLAPHLSHTSW